MKTVLKKYVPAAVLILILAALIVFFLWLDRPLELDPAQLTRAEYQESCPGVELILDIKPGQLDMTLANRGDAVLSFGAAVDAENRLFTGGGIEAALNGVWYQVPQERYASAGVGIELASEETFQARISLNPERKLPDGQYRFAFHYQCESPESDLPVREQPRYCSYARFDVAKGAYVQPESLEDVFWSGLPELPGGASAGLTLWNKEKTAYRGLYQEKELEALFQALSECGVRPAEDLSLPEEPWTVYGLTIAGEREDLEAALWGGLWVDSRGRVLETDLDPAALWERLEGKTQTWTEIVSPPCARELALLGGAWDSRFLMVSPMGGPDPDVTMEATGSDLAWTLTNHGDSALKHGNGGSAGLEVFLEDGWYQVPWVSGGHYGVTAEEYVLLPGESCSWQFWSEPYGQLPEGNYRITFRFDWEGSRREGWAAVCFQVLEDGTLSTESPRGRTFSS